ncbi:MAG: family 43 glycosylhydrolase, partial [Oscillospiraceae bacterium]|nr:family 43 glycosylhydrolase [Oscillospiraceae bacterium]
MRSKSTRRILCLILAVVMALTSAPFAFAAEEYEAPAATTAAGFLEVTGNIDFNDPNNVDLGVIETFTRNRGGGYGLTSFPVGSQMPIIGVELANHDAIRTVFGGAGYAGGTGFGFPQSAAGAARDFRAPFQTARGDYTRSSLYLSIHAEAWVGFELHEPMVINRMGIMARTDAGWATSPSRTANRDVQGSHDGETWVNLFATPASDAYPSFVFHEINNTEAFRFYRLRGRTTGGTASICLRELKFYVEDTPENRLALLEFPNRVYYRNDITLPQIDGLPLTWTSSDPAVIGHDGVMQEGITLPQNVTFTATATIGSDTVTREFLVTIPDPVLEAFETITLPATTRHSLNLPTSIEGVPVAWTSNNLAVMGHDGALVAGATLPGEVTLTVAIERFGITHEQVFVVRVYEAVTWGDPGFTSDMELIAHIDFDREPVGGASGGQYFVGPDNIGRARVRGAVQYGEIADSTGATSRSFALGSGRWLQLERGDGSPLLRGLNEFAISYYVLANSDPASAEAWPQSDTAGRHAGGQWLFYAARVDQNPFLSGRHGYAIKPYYENYIAIIDSSTRTDVRRFHHVGGYHEVSFNPGGTSPSAATWRQMTPTPVPRADGLDAGEWRRVDVHFTPYATRLYVDGVLESYEETRAVINQLPDGADNVPYAIEEIMSAAGGFASIGRRPPHSNPSGGGGASYFNGEVANIRVWAPINYRTDQERVQEAYDALELPYGTTPAVERTDAELTANRIGHGNGDFGHPGNQVRGHMYLPAEGLHGTTITWEMDVPGIVATEDVVIPYYDPAGVGLGNHDAPRRKGFVTRPDVDTTITATARIEYNGEYLEKEFVFDVLAAPVLDELDAYIFAYFTGGEGAWYHEQAFFSVSDDALHWVRTRPTNNPALVWNERDRGTRDPFIIRGSYGDKFYMIATDLSIWRRGGWGNANWPNSSTHMVIWESTDLVNWSEPWSVDVHGGILDAGHFWAPDMVYDPVTGDFFVFAATMTAHHFPTGYNGPFVWYTRTRDFRTFSEPRLWIGEDSYYRGVIDTAAILGHTGYWYRTTKVEGVGRTIIDRAMDFVLVPDGAGGTEKISSLTGRWERSGELWDMFRPADHNQVEGVQFLQHLERDWIDGRPTYAIWADAFAAGTGYIPFFSNNMDDVVPGSPYWRFDHGTYTGPRGHHRYRHGSLMTITRAEHDRVVAAFGEFLFPDSPPRPTRPEPLPPGMDHHPATFGPSVTAGMDLLAYFDFDGLVQGDPGTFTDISGNNVQARVRGAGTAAAAPTTTINVSDNTPDGSGQSFNLTPTSWISLTAEDGSGLLADMEELVVVADAYRYLGAGNNNWVFYADRNQDANSWGPGRHYIGLLNRPDRFNVERFSAPPLGGGGDGTILFGPVQGAENTVGQWNTLAMVLRPGSTAFYVNGDLVGTYVNNANGLRMPQILGSDGGYVYLGRSNWGAGGEFFNGYIDNVRIYGYAGIRGPVEVPPVEDYHPQYFNDVSVDDMIHLVDLDFEGLTEDSPGTFYDATGNARVRVMGGHHALPGATGSRLGNATPLATLGPALGNVTMDGSDGSFYTPGRWISIECADGPVGSGTGLLAGMEELVVNFDARRTVLWAGHHWAFKVVNSDTVAQSWPSLGRYISGALYSPGGGNPPATPRLERGQDWGAALGGRFNLNGVPDSLAGGQWVNMSLVFRQHSTALYVNGELAETRVHDDNDAWRLPNILGPTGGYIMLGNGGFNYGTVSENFYGHIDNVQIWGNRGPAPDMNHPDIARFEGAFHLYAATDGSELVVSTSDDLEDWEQAAVSALRVNDVPWATGDISHPHAVQRGEDDFLLFFSATRAYDGTKAIGVATADNPLGPFTAVATPLLSNDHTLSHPDFDNGVFIGISPTRRGDVIAPFVYTDPDGVSYLFFGSGSAAGVQLTSDLMGIVDGTMQNLTTHQSSFPYWGGRPQLTNDPTPEGHRYGRHLRGPTLLTAGVQVNRVGDRYNFTWTVDVDGSELQHIRRGWADSLFGPITYHNNPAWNSTAARTLFQLMNSSGGFFGPGGQSILQDDASMFTLTAEYEYDSDVVEYEFNDDLRAGETDFEITVPGEVDEITIAAAATCPLATVVGDGVDLPLVVGTNVFEIVVTSNGRHFVAYHRFEQGGNLGVSVDRVGLSTNFFQQVTPTAGGPVLGAAGPQIVSTYTLTVYREEEPIDPDAIRFVVDTVTAAPGDRAVEVAISVENNSGISSLRLDLGFEDYNDYIEIVGDRRGLFPSPMFNTAPIFSLAHIPSTIPPVDPRDWNVVDDGAMITVLFDVSLDAEGYVPIELTVSSVYEFVVDTTVRLNEFVEVDGWIYVTSAPVVASIAVTTQPTLVYTDGDALDLSDMVVTLTYDNGDTRTVAFADFAANGLTASPVDGTMLALTHDGTVVTITHTESSETATTDNLTVNALDPEVASIAVTTQPTRLVYTERNTLDLSGLVVTLTYDNGDTRPVAFADFAANGLTASPADGTALTLAHNGTVVTITHTESGETATTATLTVNAIRWGDVNNDNAVTLGDVSMLNLYVLGFPVLDTWMYRGDVNHDGDLTLGDVSLLNLYVLGFPVRITPPTAVATMATLTEVDREVVVTATVRDETPVVPGAEILVDFALTGNPDPGIGTLQIVLEQGDLTILRAVAETEPHIPFSQGQIPQVQEGRMVLGFRAGSNANGNVNVTGTGHLVTVQFLVPDDAEVGDTLNFGFDIVESIYYAVLEGTSFRVDPVIIPSSHPSGNDTVTVVAPSEFEPVTAITKTSALTVAANTPLTLAGTVVPTDATNTTIVWSGTGVENGVLTATAAGTAMVTATVVDGTAVGTNFTQTFEIVVTAPVVTGIAVTTQPALTYTVGDALDLSGLVVTLTYDNGDTRTV